MMYNADWAATCAIYNIEEDYDSYSNSYSTCSYHINNDDDNNYKHGSITKMTIHHDEEKHEHNQGATTATAATTHCCRLQVGLELAIQVRDTVFIEGPIPGPTITSSSAAAAVIEPKYRHLQQSHNKKRKKKFRNKVQDPGFQYRILSEPEDQPKVRVQFTYQPSSDDGDDDMIGTPVAVEILPVHVPNIWNPWATNWLQDWLNQKARQVLEEEESSFAVCQWVEYQAFQFFDVLWRKEQEPRPVTMVVQFKDQDIIHAEDDNSSSNQYTSSRCFPCQPKAKEPAATQPSEHHIHVWRPSHQHQKMMMMIEDTQSTAYYPQLLTTKKSSQSNTITTSEESCLQEAVLNFISKHWKEWVTVECPICFDVLPVAEAKELFPCRHLYCYDCICTYAKMIVPDLRVQRQNPFTCPLPICRRQVKIVQCIKELLTAEEMNTVREWYKNVTQPVSNMLQICPRKKCGAKGLMRRLNMDSSIVGCEACGVRWCELCLSSVPVNKRNKEKNTRRGRDQHHCDGPKHELSDCNPAQVLELCHRYRKTKSDEIKRKCEDKWPWIREYAVARVEDVEAMQWIRENGCTMCPTCKTVIERSEGCFHMHCTQCATHFCYECGDKLFPPYYGTHHCWEEQNFEQFED